MRVSQPVADAYLAVRGEEVFSSRGTASFSDELNIGNFFGWLVAIARQLQYLIQYEVTDRHDGLLFG